MAKENLLTYQFEIIPDPHTTVRAWASALAREVGITVFRLTGRKTFKGELVEFTGTKVQLTELATLLGGEFHEGKAGTVR